jgi:integrase
MTSSSGRRPVGIRKTAKGWHVYVSVHGRQYAKRWPADTALSTMKAWREQQRAKVRYGVEPPKAGRFELDVTDYLASVASMPSVADRRLHMREWAAHFVGRDKNAVTALEIRTRLEALVKAGYAASSVNKRRTALMSFYTALNGKSGYNPVRDVAKYEEAAEPRSVHPLTFLRVLACMPPSATRARLHVLLTTGWPHTQLAKLKPEHLDLEKNRAYVTPRRKGKGTAGRWLPLLPSAVAALKVLKQWDAFGEFSRSAMHSAFARGLEKLNAHRARLKLPPLALRPYDARHTFGTMLAERLQDDRAIQELMLHSRAEQTRRYTDRATSQRVRQAVGTFWKATS